MAKKVRSFTAKLAHETGRGGKSLCPVCNSELRKIKLIHSKASKANSWAPRYAMISLCKCNEKEVLN